MKTAVVKCILGNYDDWQDPVITNPEFEYHLFTDQEIYSEIFKVHKIEKKDKLNREIKILPFTFLPGYDRYVWMDGNIHQNCDLNKFITDANITVSRHPDRNCIYTEYETCVKLCKDDSEIMKQQIEIYRKNGYPENNGLVQTGFLIYTISPVTVNFLFNWWTRILSGSRRDQLSFNYILWNCAKYGIKTPTIKLIEWKTVTDNFIINRHKK